MTTESLQEAAAFDAARRDRLAFHEGGRWNGVMHNHVRCLLLDALDAARSAPEDLRAAILALPIRTGTEPRAWDGAEEYDPRDRIDRAAVLTLVAQAESSRDAVADR